MMCCSLFIPIALGYKVTLVHRLRNINGNEGEEAESEGKDPKEYTVLEISRCRRARVTGSG